MRIVLVLLVCASVASGCGARPGAPAPSAETAQPSVPPRALSVVASFYPLYEFTRRIGGDQVEVRNLVPAGAEAHDYEPTLRDVAALNASRLLVYNGAGFEPWINKLLPGLPATVGRVNATAGLPLVKAEHEVGEKGRKDQREEGLDPHVWLDPVLAQRQVDNIAAGLVKIDPDPKATYELNAARLKADLQALHVRYMDTLGRCRKRTFITTHSAFGYLASRYGLTMVPISGLSPEAEPSPARLREVVKAARRHGVRIIYFETLVSPRVAQTIAREVGAQTRVLNPVEGLTPDEQGRGLTYFTVMDENLRSLAASLDCR